MESKTLFEWIEVLNSRLEFEAIDFDKFLNEDLMSTADSFDFIDNGILFTLSNGHQVLIEDHESDIQRYDNFDEEEDIELSLKSCLKLLSVDKRLDPVNIYIEYANGTTCYEGDFINSTRLIDRLLEQDLTKIVKSVVFSCNHFTKMSCIKIILEE